jgi:hypothetical protein
MSSFGVVSFRAKGEVYRFKVPLTLKHEKLDNGLLCLSCEEPILQSYGKSWKGCMDGIYEELEMLWEQYAMEEDRKLTNGAKILKNMLLNMVEVQKR